MELVWAEAAAILLLIVFNGFFATAEIALIVIRKSYVKQAADGGRRWARVVQRLQADSKRFLATVQIGVTLTASLSGAIGGVIAIHGLQPLVQCIPSPLIQASSGFLAVSVVVVVVAYLTLVIGELVPKSIALRYPEKVAALSAQPLELVARATSLANRLLSLSTKLLLTPFGVQAAGKGSFISEEEI